MAVAWVQNIRLDLMLVLMSSLRSVVVKVGWALRLSHIVYKCIKFNPHVIWDECIIYLGRVLCIFKLQFLISFTSKWFMQFLPKFKHTTTLLSKLHLDIHNGNRTEWNPIWSVIIWVTDKIGWPRSRSTICWSQVWLQKELDNTKSCYQWIKTMSNLR